MALLIVGKNFTSPRQINGYFYSKSHFRFLTYSKKQISADSFLKLVRCSAKWHFPMVQMTAVAHIYSTQEVYPWDSYLERTRKYLLRDKIIAFKMSLFNFEKKALVDSFAVAMGHKKNKVNISKHKIIQ